jgi:hypothetical protein
MVIIIMAIGGYFINGYWWIILLVDIDHDNLVIGFSKH